MRPPEAPSDAPLRHQAETPEIVARAHRLARMLDRPVHGGLCMSLAIALGARFPRAVGGDAELSRLAVALDAIGA